CGERRRDLDRARSNRACRRIDGARGRGEHHGECSDDLVAGARCSSWRPATFPNGYADPRWVRPTCARRGRVGGGSRARRERERACAADTARATPWRRAGLARRLQRSRGREQTHGSRERFQKGLELVQFRLRQAQRLELGMTQTGCRRTIVVLEHRGQRFEFAVMTVWRTKRDVAQRRRPKSSDKIRGSALRELQLRAIGARRVAVLTRAIELAGVGEPDADEATRIRWLGRADADVVKLIVGEQRTAVASGALCAAYEQSCSVPLGGGEGFAFRARRIAYPRYIAIETRRTISDAALERLERLAQVYEHARHAVLRALGQTVPRRAFARGSVRTC